MSKTSLFFVTVALVLNLVLLFSGKDRSMIADLRSVLLGIIIVIISVILAAALKLYVVDIKSITKQLLMYYIICWPIGAMLAYALKALKRLGDKWSATAALP